MFNMSLTSTRDIKPHNYGIKKKTFIQSCISWSSFNIGPMGPGCSLILVDVLTGIDQILDVMRFV